MAGYDPENFAFQQAVSFVNHTAKSIFLTGKAGTGKTTFLRYIRQHSYKNMAVVAPTGVAAINAGGTTLHSLFQLPFGLYLHDYELAWNENDSHIYNRSRLLGQLRYSQDRRQLLQELELLIIDEVSMLRADMLDAIDTILRSVRRSSLPYGGVQVLFIGDLFQLPPVTKQQEMALLQRYYKSPFFFEAKAIQQAPPVLLELKKIYRQNDQGFIHLLNSIRDNCCSAAQLEALNKRYIPEFSPAEGETYITLTSHNHLADTINQRELSKLNGKEYTFEAAITGDFSSHSFPTDNRLILKEGAQIMFIKNDKGDERRYYNGKIGAIHYISKDGTSIKVKFAQEDEPLEIEKEKWDNIRYSYDREEDKINEETLGTFSQYPIRLAWAVTIHKSQGLTFERAIIDAGKSFAPGQVYVALSRLTTINGLVLSSPISEASIKTDVYVLEFSRGLLEANRIAQVLQDEQRRFLEQTLLLTFNFDALGRQTQELRQHAPQKHTADTLLAQQALAPLSHTCAQLLPVAEKFRSWLIKQLGAVEIDYEQVHHRTEKAAAWFQKEIEDQLIAKLATQFELWSATKKNKTFAQKVNDLLMYYKRKQEQIGHSVKITEALHNKTALEDILQSVSESKRITVASPSIGVPTPTKVPVKKGDSMKTSLSLFKQGKSIKEIAQERALTENTILSHLTSFVGSELDAGDLIPKERLDKLLEHLEKTDERSHSMIKNQLKDAYSYEEIRIGLKQLESKKGSS